MSEMAEESILTDLHSHLVPGVDDGAQSVEDALEGIGRMFDRGVRAIITTPHLDGSLTRDPAALAVRLAEFDASFSRVQAGAGEAYPELELRRGCEVMLDRPDADLSHPGVRMGGTEFVLVEWPRLHIPPGTPAVLRGLREQGVTLLIAHAERYSGYDAELSLVPRWREEGALLQVTYGSMVGRYGPEVRARALRLLEGGWVDFLATDFHGRPALRLYIDEAKRGFEALGAEGAWELLTATNPARIFRGEAPLPVPLVTDERGLLARLLARFRG
jgi:protein-tyrosine phosphatase